MVVSGNTVSRTVAATDPRDYAGIAVFRRSPDLAFNANQPSGVVVTNNTVSGFQRKPAGSTGDGFGIVVEGLNQTVTRNTVTNNDVGIQAQAGQVSDAQSTDGFDRGDAASYGGLINNNSIDGNTVGLRVVRPVVGTDVDAECNWWGAADGPSSVGTGSGDPVSLEADFVPWLLTSTLTATCAQLAEDDAPADVAGDKGTEFTDSGSFDADLAGVTASVGTATVGSNGAWTWVLDEDDLANDGLDPVVPITVTITGTALNGSVATSQFDLDISNVAPTATFVFDAVVVGGGTYQVSLTAPARSVRRRHA